MTELTPKLIIERHKEHPNATETLIESYAFAEYKKAISDLFSYAAEMVEVPNSDTALIVMTKEDLKRWKEYQFSHWYLNDPLGLKKR